ncbi:MAG: flagellum-specific ATP synthase FliI, partial [Rhodobacteraceae bacterium]|nr:flagellum-specific ATP synthase FliI [Paracoccaceae bacterium]
MAGMGLEMLRAEIGGCEALRHLARVVEVGRGVLTVSGIGADWRLGDRVRLADGDQIGGEVVALGPGQATVLTDGPVDGVRLGDGLELLGSGGIFPDDSW